jgi:hypothetical protein
LVVDENVLPELHEGTVVWTRMFGFGKSLDLAYTVRIKTDEKIFAIS